MTTVVTREQARNERHHYRLPNGTDTWISSYVGVNSVERRAKGLPTRTPESFPPPLEPIAFLVEQGPNSVIPGHYHQADQFQVFVSGEGKFGIKPIEGLTVHYAMAFTPYAPIHADSTGVEYYTLRNGWDPGARWMPEHREALKGRTKSYRHGLGSIPPMIGDADGPKSIEGVLMQPIVPAEDDGLMCALYQTTSEALISGPAPTTGRGQYWLVMRGQCEINGQQATERSLVFISPDESAPTINAGADGVAILLMQFPKRESA
ncbi:hypothetical protein [Zwartia vadi]|uniref:hypothetical protein n=1 Tax=Zwartia vadi TaxID=3058168 RepID=UPI0025B281EF|nr:hypothetical protein [Zwartia vadi]MDN3986936.1 hypothetical protein [Zwartia vadi]